MDNNIVELISPAPSFQDAITQDLVKVEDFLLAQLNTSDKFMATQISYLARAGGKRFRPLFTILVNRMLVTTPKDNIISAAAMLEMIHLATLYHDDVMDEANLRRGVPAAQVRWNNSIAILAGDYLFACSSNLASELGLEIVKQLSHTYALLVTGQFRETVSIEEGELSVVQYKQIIFEKTGSLIATCGRIAAILGEIPSQVTELVYELGKNLGIAFQIADDLIDLQSSEQVSGKNPGTDLKEGVLTLPVIYALQEDTPAAKELASLLTNKLLEDKQVDQVKELVMQSQGIAKTKKTLEEYQLKCYDLLGMLPNNEANMALQNLVKYTIERAK